MAIRSFADVPNRIVRLFLQEAGHRYDVNRGYPRFGKMTPALLARFAGRCAYCGCEPPPVLVAEHLVPMNRESIGLHAWGNVVPACKPCNDIKSGKPWETHPQLNSDRKLAIEAYIAAYGYNPDVAELRVVLGKLYDLADSQTRALIEFALVASRPYITGFQQPGVQD